MQGETFKPIAHPSFPAMLPWKLEEKTAEVGYTEHKRIFLRKKKPQTSDIQRLTNYKLAERKNKTF